MVDAGAQVGSHRWLIPLPLTRLDHKPPLYWEQGPITTPERHCTGVQIPRTAFHAARSRNNLRVASGGPVDHKESNILDPRKDPSELTAEEGLLAAMLVSNEEPTESLRMCVNWKTVRHETSADEGRSDEGTDTLSLAHFFSDAQAARRREF